VRQASSKDALSPLAQARHQFVAGKLPDYSTPSNNPLNDALLDNTRSPVPDQVAFRVDFPAWLGLLSERDRQVAEGLMLGGRTCDVADGYGLSPSRVSQLRREFERGWRNFCEE
jgi:hypothetical protein